MPKELIDLVSGPDIEQYFGRLLEIRDTAHLTHLYQEDMSIGTHLAIEELYTEILPIIDGMIEGYQGVTGRLNITIPGTRKVTDIILYLEDQNRYLMENRYILGHSWLQNELDNILKIIAITLYKLKYVK